jgi:hypothetical protein
MDFVEVLRRAWQIIWKHKVLWIFGIMAGCARGGGGGTGSGTGWRQNQPFDQNAFRQFQQYGTALGGWIGNHLWVVVVFALVVLVLIVVSIFLGTIGRIGLIRGTVQADGGAERLSFRDLFGGSRRFFWRVFGLSILVWFASVILALIIFLPLIVLTVVTFGLAVLCMLPLICLLIPVVIGIRLVVRQAIVAMVIEDCGLEAGVRRGWEVVKKNIGPIVIIWLITFVAGLLVGLLIALPILVILIPAAIVIAASGQQASFTPLIIGGVCAAAYLPILLVANGILTAYLESIWTLTYMRLTRPTEGQEIPPALPANA